MPTAAVNTKVERLTEALEALSIAIVVHIQKSSQVPPVLDGFEGIQDAREEIAAALHEFLRPALRVVGHEHVKPRRNYPDVIPK